MFDYTNYLKALINQEEENRENDLEDITFTLPQFDFNMFASSIILLSKIIKVVNIFVGLYISYKISIMIGIPELISTIISTMEIDVEFFTMAVLTIIIVGCITYFLGNDLCDSFDMMVKKYNKLIEDKDDKIYELEDNVTELENKVTELEDRVNEMNEMNKMNHNDTRNSDEIFVTIEK